MHINESILLYIFVSIFTSHMSLHINVCILLHILVSIFTLHISCVYSRWWIRNMDGAHAVGGTIPILNASKQTRKKTAFQDYNTFVFHQFWTRFLKPIKDCFDQGNGVCVCVCLRFSVSLSPPPVPPSCSLCV